MSEKLERKQFPVLILADFSDGSWYASSFAMQYLYHNDSSIFILQTHENRGWGHFMMRNLSHSLKKITKYDLQQLKNKLLFNFSIKKDQINTLSIEGNLNAVLQYKLLIKDEYFVTLSIYSSFPDSCNRQNKYLEKLIDNSHHPLFILSGDFNKQPNKKISFVGNSCKIPSKSLVDQVLKICKETQSTLEILFVLFNEVQKISDDVFNFYIENFKTIEYEIKQVAGDTKYKGLKDHLGDKTKDLLVIENS